MKKIVLLLPLLALPTLAHFYVPYLTGRGVLPEKWLLLLDGGMSLLLPFPLAALIAWLTPTSIFQRAAMFIAALVIEFALVFWLPPGSAESEMRGLTERYRQEFSIEQLRSAAEEIRNKETSGTLTVTKQPNVISMRWSHAVMIDMSQLPKNLSGKFQCVRVAKEAGRGTDVILEIDPIRGILCSTNFHEDDFWTHSMADGIYAYRYMRP